MHTGFNPPLRHHANPPDVEVIETEGLLLSERVLRYVIDERLATAITGVSGTGKTFTLEVLLRARKDIRALWIDVQIRPTMLSIAHALALQLLEEIPRASRHDLSYRLLDRLVDQPGRVPLVIVFDEAQRLNNECAEYLRYLHDPPATSFAMVLAGGNGCWETIRKEPMLESRMYEPVFFRPLSEQAVLEALPNYHPMYQNADPELLLWINEERCAGTLRRWAAFTASAAQLMCQRNQSTLSREIAAIALQKTDAL